MRCLITGLLAYVARPYTALERPAPEMQLSDTLCSGHMLFTVTFSFLTHLSPHLQTFTPYKGGQSVNQEAHAGFLLSALAQQVTALSRSCPTAGASSLTGIVCSILLDTFLCYSIWTQLLLFSIDFLPLT